MRGPFVLPAWNTVNAIPGLTSATPASAAVGSGNVVLAIAGSGFIPGAVVTWNGAERTYYVCGFVGFNGGDSGVGFESERDGDVDGEQSGVVSLEFDSIHYQLKKLGGAAKGDAAGAAFLHAQGARLPAATGLITKHLEL